MADFQFPTPPPIGPIGTLPVAQTHDSLAAARLGIDQARLNEKSSTDTQRLSLDQERHILQKQILLKDLTIHRDMIENEQAKTTMATQAARALSQMKDYDPVEAAKILADHPTSDKGVLDRFAERSKQWNDQQHFQQDYVNKTLEEQQKADAAKALESQKQSNPDMLSNAITHNQKLLDAYTKIAGETAAAHKSDPSKPDVSQELVDTTYNLKQTIKNLSYRQMQETGGDSTTKAYTAAATSTINQMGDANALGGDQAPAPPSPPNVANDEVARLLGLSKPAPPAQSGLPDAANAAVQDEEQP